MLKQQHYQTDLTLIDLAMEFFTSYCHWYDNYGYSGNVMSLYIGIKISYPWNWYMHSKHKLYYIWTDSLLWIF